MCKELLIHIFDVDRKTSEEKHCETHGQSGPHWRLKPSPREEDSARRSLLQVKEADETKEADRTGNTHRRKQRGDEERAIAHPRSSRRDEAAKPNPTRELGNMRCVCTADHSPVSKRSKPSIRGRVEDCGLHRCEWDDERTQGQTPPPSKAHICLVGR